MTFRDDSYYIGQVLEGRQTAYAALVDKHKEMVFTIAIKILRHREEAEEVAQDVFLKAFKALPSFKGEARFSTWLYRIAYNTAISQSRRKKPVFPSIDDEMIDNYTTDAIEKSVNELSREAQINAVNAVMENLPEEENLLLTLFYKNEKSVADIAEICGYSPSNVKVKLYRIRKRMYDDLKRCLENTDR
jgi:RNA polymerase sigma-70 factor (ECF subfamily)